MAKAIASIAGAVALLSAGSASATIMVFQGTGQVSEFNLGTVWSGAPHFQIGDAATLTFAYATDRCEIISGTCYGGDSEPAPGLGANPVGQALMVIDGLTIPISGSTYDQLALGAYNIQDGENTLLVSLPAPDGATITTDFSGAGGSARLTTTWTATRSEWPFPTSP